MAAVAMPDPAARSNNEAGLGMTLLSLEEFERRAEELGPCELVKGVIHELPMNNAKHNALTARWSRILGNFVEANGIKGRILASEVGVFTKSNPDTARAADVAYLSCNRLPELPVAGFLRITPELLIEIISPDNRWTDTWEKTYEYFESGAKLVWIVDPYLREIRVFTSPKEQQLLRAASGDTLTGGDVLPGFSVAVADMFEG